MDTDTNVVQLKALHDSRLARTISHGRKGFHGPTPLVWRGSDMPDLRKGIKATRIVRFSILTGWERDEPRGDFGKPKAGTAR